MTRALLLALGCLLSGVSVSSNSVFAAENWYGCTHAEWAGVFGFSHILVTETLKKKHGEGVGVTCELLGSSAQTAQSAACTQSGGNKTWGKFAADGKSLNPISC